MLIKDEIRNHQKSWVLAEPQNFSDAYLAQMLKVTSNCLLCSCSIFKMLVIKMFPAVLLLSSPPFTSLEELLLSCCFEINLKHRAL